MASSISRNLPIAIAIALSLLSSGAFGPPGRITHNADGAFIVRGVHGQPIYVDPAVDMVVARFASHPVYAAVARYLMQKAGTP